MNLKKVGAGQEWDIQGEEGIEKFLNEEKAVEARVIQTEVEAQIGIPQAAGAKAEVSLGQEDGKEIDAVDEKSLDIIQKISGEGASAEILHHPEIKRKRA